MVWITSNVGTCNEYTDELGQRQASVVLSPLRVIEDFNENMNKTQRVFWGCSRYYHCQNEKCELSLRSRDERKKKRQTE